MKIPLGLILVGCLLAGIAEAQALKASDVDFICLNLEGRERCFASGEIISVTMPSSRDPKWTVVYSTESGDTHVIVTTHPVEIHYRKK